MEFTDTKRPDPPITLAEEHAWIDYCRHIPIEQNDDAEVAALNKLRHIIEQINQYNSNCDKCGKESIVQYPLELSCVTSKRGRTTLDPSEIIEYINIRLNEIMERR